MLLKERKWLWNKVAEFAYKRTALPIFSMSTGYMGNQWGVSDGKTDVNNNVALNTGFVYKCIDMRSNSVATAMIDNQELEYYSNTKESEEILDHPYWDVMRYVNDQYTPYDLWYITSSSFDFTGRSIWWVETEGAFNLPVRINPILPDMGRFLVLRDKLGKIVGYELHTGMEKIKFDPFEIFYHTAVNVNDSTYGLGLVSALVREANIDKLQKQKVLTLLQNGGLGKAHVQFKGNPKGDVFQKSVDAFNRSYNGVGKDGQFVFTDEATDITPLVDNSTLEAAVSILGLTRDQIIQLSGVMRVSLGIGGSTTKADAETQYLVYLRDHITPMITNLTSRLSQDFVQRYYPQETGWLCVECESIIPGDQLAEDLHNKALLSTGQITVNELLKESGKDPIGEIGDKRYLTGDLVPMDDMKLDFTDIIGANTKPSEIPKQDTPMDKTKKQVALGANSIQDTALNGAQTTSLLSILQSVSTGMLPKDSAIQTIMAAFPTIDATEAGSMVNPIEVNLIQQPTA